MSPTLKEPIVQLRNKEPYLCAMYVPVTAHLGKGRAAGFPGVGNGQSFLPRGLCTCCAPRLMSSPLFL